MPLEFPPLVARDGVMPQHMVAPAEKPRKLALADGSHEPWAPPRSFSTDPPFLLYDVGYAASTYLVLALCCHVVEVCGWVHAGGLLHVVGHVVPIVGCLVVLWACRTLEPTSYTRLLEAEALLLSTVRGDVRHQWNRFRTRHAEWHIHSLVLKASPPTAGGDSLASNGGDRPAVVLLHGHSAGAAHWEAVFDRLSALGDFHVLDMPGWGRSPCPPELVHELRPERITDLHAEMVQGWLDAVGLKRVVVIGHSFGGFHAVQFAWRHPSYVSQLILAAPAGLTPMMPDSGLIWGILFRYMPPQRIARLTGRLGYFVYKTLALALIPEDPRFPDFYYQLAAQTASTGAGDTVAARFLQLTPAGRFWWRRPCLTKLLSLSMPVSIIWGQKDDLLPPILAPLLHRIRPHTDTYLIKGALHNPAHNNPHAFCDAIADAIVKHQSGGVRRALSVHPDDAAKCRDGDADQLLDPLCPASRTTAAAGISGPLLASVSPALRVDGLCCAASDDGEPGQLAMHATAAAGNAGEAAGALDGRVTHAKCGSPPLSPAASDSPTESSRPGAEARVSAGAEHFARRVGLLAPATPSSLERVRRASAATQAELCIDGTACSAAPAPTGGAAGLSCGSAAAHSGSDGVEGQVGFGRGFCHGCFRAVSLHKSYWRCACAAWSFNAYVDGVQTKSHFAALVAFLDELYIYGTFDARTSEHLILVLATRSPLPRAASGSGAEAHPAAVCQGAPAVAAAPAPGRAELRLRRTRGTARPAGEKRPVFPPAPAPFVRGDALLLD
jgi:pimeloyl-ACP methyl ester carboxylesterase